MIPRHLNIGARGGSLPILAQQTHAMSQGGLEIEDLDHVEADCVRALDCIWHSQQVESGEDSGCWLSALQGLTTLSRHRIHPGKVHSSAWVQHGPEPSDPRLSCFSGFWLKLLREEWYSSDITPSFYGDGMQNYSLERNEDDRVERRYHGTTLQAAVSMMRTGGFIPGPNGHGCRGKYLQGLFCTDTVADAFQRVDPWRVGDGDRLSFMGCPVVVELEVAAFKLRQYHRYRPDLRVIEGMPDVLMQGVQLVKVHGNRRFFSNFSQTIERTLTKRELCGTGSRGSLTCGHFISLDSQAKLYRKRYNPQIGYKSGKGMVYCPRCAGYCCFNSRNFGFE